MRPSSVLRLLPAALALTCACSFSDDEMDLYSCADTDTEATPDSGTDAGSDAGSDAGADSGADGSHPSQHATYLSACVAPDGVSEEDAAILRGMAE
ncbi:MAG: hypothetical protein M0R80_28825 [Proteobacteria bacterium]|jgi:hypothetical protein|nr:hypothetical protein [Pseudomonadota bacterium]